MVGLYSSTVAVQPLFRLMFINFNIAALYQQPSDVQVSGESINTVNRCGHKYVTFSNIIDDLLHYRTHLHQTGTQISLNAIYQKQNIWYLVTSITN